MKILITGSSSFIGKNIKEQLERKYLIYGPSSSELDLLNDRAVYDYIKEHNFDIVIHNANWNNSRNSKKDISKVLSNNLKMFFNVARCNEYYGRMIYFGSGAEYYRRYIVPEINEEKFDSYVPDDDYGFSKYIMCKYAELSSNIYNLRLFGIFGKYEDIEIRFISNAICKTLFDLPITIKQDRRFSYLYINDLVKIVDYFIRNDTEYNIYNVTPDEIIDLYSIAKIILKISKKDLSIIVGNSGYAPEYSGDNRRLKQEIIDLKFTPIYEAVKELYSWYSDNINIINKELLLIDK